MAVPVLAVGVIVSLLDFGLNETIVPYTTREARYLYEVELKKRQLRGVFANQQIWARVREGFVAANNYDREKHELRGITLYRVVPGYRLSDIVRAPSARWDGRRWRAEGMSSLRVTSGGTVHPFSEDRLELSLRPADFEVLRRDPDEFSLWELNRYIHGLRRSGLDPGGYLVGRDLKFAAPFSCLIMVALGVALTLDPLPRTVGLGRSFGVAIAIGFCYWLALGLSSSLGRSGLLHAWIAAWLPNLVFSTVAAAIFLFGEER
jgi:lipopolysaccharide export system permease protein